MYCGKCGKKIEGTAGICYYCQTRYTITAANLPCPSCAAKDAELERLREAVDALQANLCIFIHAHESGNSVPTFVVKDAEECCRRAKEGK